MRKPLVALLALVSVAAPVALAGEAVRPTAAAGAETTAAEGYLSRTRNAATARDRYALGLWCRENGLLDEARAEFAAAVRKDPNLDAAREELGWKKVDGSWVPSEEAMKAKGLVRHDGRWMLPEERALALAPKEEKERFAAEERRARTLLETMAGSNERAGRLAKEAFASVDKAARVGPLCFALRADSVPLRVFAAAELGALGDRRALRPLVFRALRDPDLSVRNACVDAAMTFKDPELLAPFADAFLNSGSAGIRSAAASAMGRLGDVRGVQYLVYAIEGHGGGPRSYIYVANQTSFIQDFDVEVAQTAFIADPMVGILQDGAVLDVKVVSTEWYGTRVERQAIYGALRGLTGQDLPDDSAAWSKWYRESRAKR